MKSKLSSPQPGVALLSVLLILVLLATLAAYTAEEEDLAIRRLSNFQQAEQSFQVAIGGEQWGVKVLEKDIVDDQLKGPEAFDHPTETWGNLGAAVEVEGTGTTMLVSIVDAQGKMNINNLIQGRPLPERVGDQGQLVDEEGIPLENQTREVFWYQVFRNLLISVGSLPELADVVVDWLDINNQESGLSGAEDLYYMGLETPYRTANRQLVSLGELKFLRGFDAQQIARISPYITALPVDIQDKAYTLINVNSAPEVLLASLTIGEPLSPETFTEVVKERAGTPFVNLEDYRNLLDARVPGGAPPGTDNLLSVSSNYFINRSCAETGRVKFSQQSLLKKIPVDQIVKVIHRERFYGCPDLALPDKPESQSGKQ